MKECFKQIKPLLDKIPYRYVIIKGEPLSVQSYGKLGERYSCDVDILVSRSNLQLFEKLLENSGFYPLGKSRNSRITQLCVSHQTLPWSKPTSLWDNVVIDLNFDLFWGEYEGERIDIGEFLSDTIEMDIYGVKVKTLPPLKSMVQLILHHYKDMNSIYLLATRKSIKYDMFKDVYHLWKNNKKDISLEKLYSISSEYQIIPFVFYILYYTNQIFNDSELEKYVNAFKTPEGEALLNCYGLCDKERKEWKYDFQTRLESDNLYDLIKDDLTEKDIEKIRINKRIFMGVSE